MSLRDDLPSNIQLYESSGQVGEVVNPFESIPFPNCIRVGLAREDYPRDEEHQSVACFMEINHDGTAYIYDDPLGSPVAIFCPEDIAIFEFLAAHFSHYEQRWKEMSIEARRTAMHSTDDPDSRSVERAEQNKAAKPAWWWAGMHSDAMHPGDRKDCEHCQKMIIAFGPMPPKTEITAAYLDNLNIDGPAPTIREIVLTPPGPPESERQKFDTESGLPIKKGGKGAQPQLSKEWLNK